jgi:hypothetical protein
MMQQQLITFTDHKLAEKTTQQIKQGRLSLACFMTCLTCCIESLVTFPVQTLDIIPKDFITIHNWSQEIPRLTFNDNNKQQQQPWQPLIMFFFLFCTFFFLSVLQALQREQIQHSSQIWKVFATNEAKGAPCNSCPLVLLLPLLLLLLLIES